MPRITKVYTRQGDDGKTVLSSGQTVAKDSPRVAAIGTIDELNSHIGLALSLDLGAESRAVLTGIQNDLFHLGSDLSFVIEGEEERPIPQIESRHVAKIESLIDEMNAHVGPLQNFVLPGGSHAAAQLHVARTVCRRAERDLAALSRSQETGALVPVYINRLSDLLFVMARYENKRQGAAEPLWDSRA